MRVGQLERRMWLFGKTMIRRICSGRLEEYHGRTSAESKIAKVRSSRKNGRKCLA